VDAPEPFHPHTHCCHCGQDNRHGTSGYAGERVCPHCGLGGEGEYTRPDAFVHTPAAGRFYHPWRPLLAGNEG
jgi:hypothetical protein